MLDISPVGQQIIYALEGSGLQRSRRSAPQTTDLWTLAGNEGLSPGRLCVSYSRSKLDLNRYTSKDCFIRKAVILHQLEDPRNVLHLYLHVSLDLHPHYN